MRNRDGEQQIDEEYEIGWNVTLPPLSEAESEEVATALDRTSQSNMYIRTGPGEFFDLHLGHETVLWLLAALESTPSSVADGDGTRGITVEPEYARERLQWLRDELRSFARQSFAARRRPAK